MRIAETSLLSSMPLATVDASAESTPLSDDSDHALLASELVQCETLLPPSLYPVL